MPNVTKALTLTFVIRISSFGHLLLNAAAILLFERMQPALGLRGAAPAAGALVGFAFGDGAGAGPAADAGEALVVERVVRDVLVENPLPDVFLRPIRQRADLHEVELLVPLDDRRPSAVGALVATDAAHPGMVFGRRVAQHLHLAV